MMGMRTRFNNILLHGVLPLEIRYQKLIDKGGLKVALYVLERVDEEEWRRRISAAGAAGSKRNVTLTRNRRGEEHMERSRERAAARLARGETLGAPLRPEKSFNKT